MRMLAVRRFICIAAFALAATMPALARAAVRVDRDVQYGTAGTEKLLMDAYVPDGGMNRPWVVLIHGGGFIGGDKAFYIPTGNRFARRGYVAFSLNYRLAPKNPYPAQVDDVQRAVRWIRAHARDYAIDPARAAAMGDSAGGYLSTMLGIRDTRDNSDAALAAFSSRVSCVVDLYGPSDFTIPEKSAAVNPTAIFLLNSFFGKTQEQAPDLYKEGSPITYVDAKACPFLIIHGTADELVPLNQSERLCDALQKAGVDVSLVELYKFKHGFIAPGTPKQADLLADQFLDQHLKP